MAPKHILLSGLLLLLFSIRTFSQNDWILKQDKEGIKVYTKNLENSPFKAVKTVCTIDASLTKLTAVLLDINSSKDWVYATKLCTILKQPAPSELFYYSEVAVPWPVNNRDFIVRLKVSQDAKTKIVTVEGENKPTLLPEKKNIVRIKDCYSKWIIVPLANGQVKIEYVLQVDPGGMIPAWLINLFATKGPFESFKNLRLQVKKPAYNHVVLPFIKD
jgi:START domain